MIFYNYEGFFGKRRESKEEVDERSTGPDTTIDFDYSRYKWLMMVQKICNELNLIPKQVYEMKYLECLNWLSMWNLIDKMKKQK